MPQASYHRQQAEILVRLAQNTSDQDTSRQLMNLAAEHTALADADAAHREQQHSPKTAK
jgi:sulfur transfer protein SufE